LDRLRRLVPLLLRHQFELEPGSVPTPTHVGSITLDFVNYHLPLPLLLNTASSFFLRSFPYQPARTRLTLVQSRMTLLSIINRHSLTLYAVSFLTCPYLSLPPRMHGDWLLRDLALPLLPNTHSLLLNFFSSFLTYQNARRVVATGRPCKRYAG
jgi:hypothetical protein